MKYFVFYDDDTPEAGGIGMEDFGMPEDVAEFIEERLVQSPDERNLTDYTVIYGRELTIEAIKTAIKVRVNH